MNTSSDDTSKTKLEALTTLHDGLIKNLIATSERSFRTTLQTLTLNVAVVAGLIGLLSATKVELSMPGKSFATVLLFIFNYTIVTYLRKLGNFHKEERAKFQLIQKALGKLAQADFMEIPPKSDRWFLIFTGSGLFRVAVTIAAFCSVVALWIPLITPEPSAVSTPKAVYNCSQAVSR
jgi:hypothetical protein